MRANMGKVLCIRKEAFQSEVEAKESRFLWHATNFVESNILRWNWFFTSRLNDFVYSNKFNELSMAFLHKKV